MARRIEGGRDEFTPEEWAQIDGADATARARLQALIAQAGAPTPARSPSSSWWLPTTDRAPLKPGGTPAYGARRRTARRACAVAGAAWLEVGSDALDAGEAMYMEHVHHEIVVRPERPSDQSAVYRVNELAFGRRDEADLVDRLRGAGKAVVSLVAEDANWVVGHILFSLVSIGSSATSCLAVGLAPMAVLPDWQRRGVGSSLVRGGLDECRRLGQERVVVLGHPEYYPRFGSVPASRFGIGCEYDTPDDAFMVMELRPDALRGCAGTARYAAEFAGIE